MEGKHGAPKGAEVVWQEKIRQYRAAARGECDLHTYSRVNERGEVVEYHEYFTQPDASVPGAIQLALGRDAGEAPLTHQVVGADECRAIAESLEAELAARGDPVY